MASTCPGCGKKFNIFDRISGVPLCLTCQKAGVLVSREAVQKEEGNTDLIAGWCLALGAIAFVAFILFVRARDGAPFGTKLRLIGYVMIPLGAGIAMIGRAKARSKR